jgi:hypothetical protein
VLRSKEPTVGDTRTREVHPVLANLRGQLGPAVRDGKRELAEQIQRELAEAKFRLDIQRAVDAFEAKSGPIDDLLTDTQVESLTALLGGA